MILEQRQQQSLSQNMMMNQQMLNAVAFLNLSSEELQEEVAKEVKRNPALIFKSSSGTSAAGAEASDKNQSFLESIEDTSYQSLQETLLKQARESIADDFVLDAAILIIQNLDRNGFNCVPLKELFSDLIEEKKFTKFEIKTALKTVQHLEPIGCACDNLRHSLIVQAGILFESPETGAIMDVYKPVYDLATRIIRESYESLAKLSDPEELLQSLAGNNIEVDEENSQELIEELINLIDSLNPYPGRLVSDSSYKKELITPIAEVIRDGDKFKVVLNDTEVPAIEISPEYKHPNKALSKEEKKKTAEMVNKAKMLISALSFRNQTALKVLTAIVNIQQNFFAGRVCRNDNEKKCPGYLKPLRQSDLAEILELSTSTVSRLANQKYIRCEWGVFEIKKLFSIEVNNGLSRDFVMGQIKEAIKSNTKKLSDAKISELLKMQGIEISTRTVNKYRKELHIPSSYYR